MSEGLVLDTNIILYSIGGDLRLTKSIATEHLHVSAMTRMEALVYHGKDPMFQQRVQEFLSVCRVVEIDQEVQDLAITIRVKTKLKLPDAIIVATAKWLDRPILTTDKGMAKAKDFIEVLFYDRK